MKVCKNCRNAIPEGMRVCPHCEKMPPRLFPNFYLYLFLTLVALGSAVYFRPFAGGRMLGELSTGTLWASFCIFLLFTAVFAFVCMAVLRDCRKAKLKLSRAEAVQYKNVCRHIAAGRHYYDNGEFCTVCGYRRKRK